MLAELVRQSGVVDGRFEGGFLLSRTPHEFLRLEPYVGNLKSAWGLSEADLQYICEAETFAQMYVRLLERSNIPDKNTAIYDKTPRYMRHLRDVLAKTSVPCVVLVKDPRALFWSRRKRERISVRHFCHYYSNYAKEFHKALDVYPDRILLVRYEELCTSPVREGRRVYEFLNLDFDAEYVRLKRPGDPYVQQGGINAAALDDYKHNVTRRDQDFILEQTASFAHWHWHA